MIGFGSVPAFREETPLEIGGAGGRFIPGILSGKKVGINRDQLTLTTVNGLDFAQVARLHYATLYRFALALVRREADAADLTQQTFYLLAARGHQLRDPAKVKAWLTRTLYREFLAVRRQENRMMPVDPETLDDQCPDTDSAVIEHLDAATVQAALLEVEDPYRAPLILFYLEEYSYREIAEILDVPAGTVMSRLSRGKDQLKQLLAKRAEDKTIVALIKPAPAKKSPYG